MRRHPLRHARRAYLLPALLLAALAAASVAGSARPLSAAATTGLVGAYSFDAGSGTSVADSSGSANNGTLSGPTWTTAGKNGKALSFDGVNDWVTIADNASLDFSNGMTLEAWVKPTGQDAIWRTVVTKEKTGNLTYGLFSNSNSSRPNGIVTIGSSPTQRMASGTVPVAAAAWTHLATTYDGATLRLYSNGTQVGSQAVTGAMANSSGALRIGGNAVWAEWFSGQIDDLRLYNRALTVAEVQSDMNTPVGGTPPPPADTQAPTAPSGLTASGQTQTQITLNWTASSDNVAVTGYSRYSNGTLISSGTGNSFSFTGLTCGTSYTLAVDAYDAAGNRSTRPSISASTLACAAGTGPVAAYSFDAASGTSLTDNSGSGNTGSISGATWTSAGKSGGALNFDGVNDLVTVADKASLDLTTGMTLEAWVRPTANSTWRTVVTKETSGNLTYGLFSNSDVAQPSSIVSIGANPVQDITRGTAEVPMSAWAHLASTYDGAVLRLYLNGTQVSSKNVTGAMANSAGPLQIGGNNVWAEWFQGQMDDLRIYNRALTPSQLQTDMNTPVAPPPAGDSQAPSAPAGLVVSGQTQTALTLSWNASTDNVGVTGYSTYRNSAAAGTTTPATRTYTYTGLACGTAYSLGVDAADAAGNRSAQATASGTTSACTPGDTQAPSVPASLVVSGQTQTALTLSWNASTDNVGVTGYSTYRSGSAAGSTAAATRTYTYTGLTCGNTYPLAVDAVDAAGNRSGQGSVNGTTSACAPPPPPSSGVANVWVDTDGGSCIRKATAAAYVSAEACTSFQNAWSAMASGDTARVRPGVYGQQVITGNKTAPTFIIGDAGVTISGSTPASCGYQSGLVCANANYLSLNNVTVNSGSTHGQSSGSEINGTNVTFDHVNLHGSFVSLYPRGQNFTWRVGSLGQDGVAGGQRSCNTGDGEPVWIESSAAGATLDQIRFNSMSASGAACSGSVDGFHLEYVRVQNTQNVTISNSVFVDDGGTGNGAGSGKIFITSSSSSASAANGLRLLGNTFGSVKGSYAIQTHANVQNANGWQIKNNAFVQPVMSPNPPAGAACGNTGPVNASWKAAC